MTNRFKVPVMRKAYDNCVIMFKTKNRNLFYPNGTHCMGNSIASFFWRGYDGVFIGSGWDAASKKTVGYAIWRAGQDCSKAKSKKQKELEKSSS